jgi:hypothetical protein
MSKISVYYNQPLKFILFCLNNSILSCELFVFSSKERVSLELRLSIIIPVGRINNINLLLILMGHSHVLFQYTGG